jgi:hypothetical protein
MTVPLTYFIEKPVLNWTCQSTEQICSISLRATVSGVELPTALAGEPMTWRCAVPVVSMSKKEFDRLEVSLGIQSGRLRVADASNRGQCHVNFAERCHLYIALTQNVSHG